MQYTTLGRTDIEVSVIGVGCGGPSQLGQNTHKDRKESIRVVREAIDLGVNFIDTAECYDTEDIVGEALRGVPRDKVVLSTKKNTWGDKPITPRDVVDSLEQSLKNLGVDYIDVYHLHGLGLDEYDHFHDRIVPTMLKLRDQGKIRAVGVTEEFGKDSGHAMLQRALEDDVFDVVMVGHNLLNQSARERVFARTIEKNVGTLIMFAVRRAMSRPERLREIINDLIERASVDPALLDDIADPLGFLVHESGASTIPDAAYRFCRHEPGAHVILTGTGDVNHMRANIESVLKPDLPEADRERIRKIFQAVDDVSGL